MSPNIRLPLLIIGAALMGCEESTGPAAESLGGAVDIRAVDDELPPNYGQMATILIAETWAGFRPGIAWGEGFMWHTGNAASQSLALTVRRGVEIVASGNAESHRHELLPVVFQPGFVDSLAVARNVPVQDECGLVVDVQVIHRAWHQFWTTSWNLLTWGAQAVSEEANARQPQCTCRGGGGGSEESSAYPQPLAALNASCSGQSGDGTTYDPGDKTDGETVTWDGGQGNGGSSECGAEAVVEYICIDVFDEEMQQWETWDCGYATTC